MPTATALLWLLRLLWLTLPLTAGTAVAEAFEDRSAAVAVTAAVGAWALWGVVLLATLVRRPLSLTVVRIGAPAAVALVVVAAVAGGWGLAQAVAVAATVAAAGVALLGDVADAVVQGSAYGDEARFVLRAPGALLAGPIPLAWAVVVAGASLGPMLLAARSWVAGGLFTIVGVPAAVLAARALHRLSGRWVVFVPAGLVLRDIATVDAPTLFRRGDVAGLRAAPADTAALDLTAGSPGMAVELTLVEEVPLGVADARGGSHLEQTAQLLCAPLRPGAVLAEAARRRFPVG